MTCAVPVLLPGRVVPAVVAPLVSGRKVGVLTPNAAQAPWALRKWRADGFDAIVTHAPPGDHEALAAAAGALRTHDLALVVLDCMGHDEGERAAFAAKTGRPVLLAQSAVARTAAEWLEC